MFIQNETKQRYQILNRSPDISRDGTPRLGEQGITNRSPKQRTLPNRTTAIIPHHPPHRKLPPRPTTDPIFARSLPLNPGQQKMTVKRRPGCLLIWADARNYKWRRRCFCRHERARDDQLQVLRCWGEWCMWRRQYMQTRGGENESYTTMITRRERGRFVRWWAVFKDCGREGWPWPVVKKAARFLDISLFTLQIKC